MRRPPFHLALALLGLLSSTAAPAGAHDFWIEASDWTPEPGAPVAVRLRIGDSFPGAPVPLESAWVERFEVVSEAGRGEVTPVGEPAGLWAAGASGVHAIVYDSRPDSLTLDAEAFEGYLAEEGLEEVSRLRRARGQSGSPGREVFSRSAKALVAAGEGGGEGYRLVAGLPLELVPERDPFRLGAGEALPVRLLFQGRPLAGALVEAASPRAPMASARTDAEGRVRLLLPRGGLWRVTAVHMVPALAESGADWESVWASLAFEVPEK